jgi:Na+-driven multidrug efflux pump
MLSFFSDGFQKTIIAKTTNYIGMGAKHKIHELFKVSIKIYLCFVLLLATIFILFGNSLFNFFNTSDLELLNNSYYDKILLLFFTWSFLVADGLIHTLGGFLISFRYTNYVMIINSICCWLLGVLPIYLLAYKAPKPWTIFAIFTIYSMIIAIIFWRKIKAPEKQFMAAAIISH